MLNSTMRGMMRLSVLPLRFLQGWLCVADDADEADDADTNAETEAATVADVVQLADASRLLLR